MEGFFYAYYITYFKAYTVAIDKFRQYTIANMFNGYCMALIWLLNRVYLTQNYSYKKGYNMLYNGIQKLNNNWKELRGNSCKVLFNGLIRDKNKLPSKVKYINKNNIDVATIQINNIFRVQYYTANRKELNRMIKFILQLWVVTFLCIAFTILAMALGGKDFQYILDSSLLMIVSLTAINISIDFILLGLYCLTKGRN